MNNHELITLYKSRIEKYKKSIPNCCYNERTQLKSLIRGYEKKIKELETK